MSKGIIETVVGGLEIAAGIALDLTGVGGALGNMLILSGAGEVFAGIADLLANNQGLGNTVRNPIEPWNVVYGQAKVGGTLVYCQETGSSDKYLHMVYVLACHPCYAFDGVLFDNRRVILAWTGNTGNTVAGNSQWNSNISSISRQNDVVTVTLATPFVGLGVGDPLVIQNVSADPTLNGTFTVQTVPVTGTTFTYVCGGNPVSITNQGQATTAWPQYGDTVHCEYALGNQTASNPPFPGLLASGDTGSQGFWTSQHLLQGRTAVYLRLKYEQNIYPGGFRTSRSWFAARAISTIRVLTPTAIPTMQPCALPISLRSKPGASSATTQLTFRPLP